MNVNKYQINTPDNLVTPAMLFYEDYIAENVRKAIEIAGDPGRLWPHTKTHKTRELTALLIKQGVTRFKCATIAEAEIAASCSPTDIILAYPLVGPNVSRFVALQQAYPETRFWAIGDHIEQIKCLAQTAEAAGVEINFLVDVIKITG